jgi:hypothetical protein
MRRAAALLSLAWTLGGCAATTSGPDRDRMFISDAEVQATEARNAFELVERLRPLWLQSRGERSTHLDTQIVVFQDQAMLGDVEMLRSIPIEFVVELRALDSAQAGRLPGLGGRHVERAIMVVTRRR